MLPARGFQHGFCLHSEAREPKGRAALNHHLPRPLSQQMWANTLGRRGLPTQERDTQGCKQAPLTCPPGSTASHPHSTGCFMKYASVHTTTHKKTPSAFNREPMRGAHTRAQTSRSPRRRVLAKPKPKVELQPRVGGLCCAATAPAGKAHPWWIHSGCHFPPPRTGPGTMGALWGHRGPLPLNRAAPNSRTCTATHARRRAAARVILK